MNNKLTCIDKIKKNRIVLKSKNKTVTVPKSILVFAKILQFLSTKLITLYVAKLFTTPIKHKIPRRELEMDKNSIQEILIIPSLQKEVMIYEYGKSDKKILLVHGWSGRGTQLVRFADELIKLGYSTLSFDAPAHGKSTGKTTIMSEFIAAVLEIEKKYGPFEAAIGHSLGGMTLLNSVKRGLQLKKIVIIGSGDKVQDIVEDFIAKLGLKPDVGIHLKKYFEKKLGEEMENYSAYLAAKEVDIPVLVIHDENDYEVPVQAGQHIYENLKNGELLLTKNLGHRKILGNPEVIEKAIQFIIK